YKASIPKNGGPQIPDELEDPKAFKLKMETAIQATLKSEKAKGETYSQDEKELMIWYNYHFLGRGKPTTHIQVLSSVNNEQIKKNLPPVFKEIFARISSKLKHQS
ncbi:hypothetical protein, partial [Fluviicola sp.]